MNKVKAFSLIIALKRKKKNSKILKRAKYKLSADYNLHPTTFCKLLQQCISEGWIEEVGDYYHVKKFSFIVRDFCEKSDLRFHFHNILGPDHRSRHQEVDVKAITEEILSKLLLDNVMAPQEYIISLKKGLSSKNSRTVKTSIRKLKKLGLYSCADEVEATIQKSVVTSDRHTAARLKITRYRARKVLNAGVDAVREIKSDWRLLRNALVDYDAARREFPRATVIVLPHYGMIKICHGSVLTRVIKNYEIE